MKDSQDYEFGHVRSESCYEFKPRCKFLEAQLLSNYIDDKDTFSQSVTHGTFSSLGHITVVCGLNWTLFKVLPPRI